MTAPLKFPSYNYDVGTRVRLISGIDGSKVPGHHFNPSYATVCRVDAEHAEFLGVPRSSLRLEERVMEKI